MRGKLQHVTFDIDLVDEDFLTDGTMFDGSSIAGWKAINESDMKLRPDLTTAYIDPFYQQTTMFLFCDVLNPDTNTPYNRDPRSIAKAALNYVKSAASATRCSSARKPSSSSSTTCAGPPRRTTPATPTTPPNCRSTAPRNTKKATWATARAPRAATSRSTRSTRAQDLRGEMLAVMGELGMEPEKHHHEVAPAQHELGLKFADLITMADRLQLYKYVIHNVAAAYGKTATFMAKPMFADNGSGMHVHQSIWNERQAAVRRRQVRRPVATSASTTSAASSSTPRRSTPSPTRPPTPTSAWCRATKPR